jgi:hypothetical protein
MILNGNMKIPGAIGYIFGKNLEYTECHQFDKFFISIEEVREMKLNEIGIQ